MLPARQVRKIPKLEKWSKTGKIQIRSFQKNSASRYLVERSTK